MEVKRTMWRGSSVARVDQTSDEARTVQFGIDPKIVNDPDLNNCLIYCSIHCSAGTGTDMSTAAPVS